MVGVLGMLAGAGVFVALHPALQPVIKGLGDLGKVTLPEVAGVSPWVVVAGLVAVGGLALWMLGRLERPQPPGTERRGLQSVESVGANHP
jgi:hypothetical protein